jgi:hypothetical protein
MAQHAERPADAAMLLGTAQALLQRLQLGPLASELKPSQMGPRRYQFFRDTIHTRELRVAGHAAFDAMPVDAFEAALATGRSLNTSQAIELALELAALHGKQSLSKLGRGIVSPNVR